MHSSRKIDEPFESLYWFERQLNLISCDEVKFEEIMNPGFCQRKFWRMKQGQEWVWVGRAKSQKQTQ